MKDAWGYCQSFQWKHLRVKAAGCTCSTPLIGWRQNVGPRCRTCNVVAILPSRELFGPGTRRARSNAHKRARRAIHRACIQRGRAHHFLSDTGSVWCGLCWDHESAGQHEVPQARLI